MTKCFRNRLRRETCASAPCPRDPGRSEADAGPETISNAVAESLPSRSWLRVRPLVGSLAITRPAGRGSDWAGGSGWRSMSELETANVASVTCRCVRVAIEDHPNRDAAGGTRCRPARARRPILRGDRSTFSRAICDAEHSSHTRQSESRARLWMPKRITREA